MGSEASESESVRDDEENVAPETFGNNTGVGGKDTAGFADQGGNISWGGGVDSYMAAGNAAPLNMNPPGPLQSEILSFNYPTATPKQKGILESLLDYVDPRPAPEDYLTPGYNPHPTAAPDKRGLDDPLGIRTQSGESEQPRPKQPQDMGLLSARPLLPQIPLSEPYVPTPYAFQQGYWDGNQFIVPPIMRK